MAWPQRAVVGGITAQTRSWRWPRFHPLTLLVLWLERRTYRRKGWL